MGKKEGDKTIEEERQGGERERAGEEMDKESALVLTMTGCRFLVLAYSTCPQLNKRDIISQQTDAKTKMVDQIIM